MESRKTPAQKKVSNRWTDVRLLTPSIQAGTDDVTKVAEDKSKDEVAWAVIQRLVQRRRTERRESGEPSDDDDDDVKPPEPKKEETTPRCARAVNEQLRE